MGIYDAPTELYRHYNADGQLLYVGISSNSVVRWFGHKTQAQWASQTVRIEIKRFPSRDAAMVAEQKAIADECPVHNISPGYVPRSSKEDRTPILRAYDNVIARIEKIYAEKHGS